MTETHVGDTLNFTIMIEDRDLANMGPWLTSLATRLEPTLENDFARLAGLFGYQDRFGKEGDKIVVFLDAAAGLEPDGSIAEHDGYIPGDSYMRLTTRGPVFAPHTKQTVEEGIKALFVAELAEILLSRKSHDGRGSLDVLKSDGDGFSRVMASWLHPRGYYEVLGLSDYGPDRAYSVVHWMNHDGAPRPDLVSNPPSQKDIRGVGCAVAFLHFLHTQEGRSWASIIDGLDGTLPLTYTRLTGASDGFAKLRSLLDGVFPVGMDVNWSYENPFPLLDPSRRSIDFPPILSEGVDSEDPVFVSDVLDKGEVEVRPTPICPPGRFSFEIRRINGRCDIATTVVGFGSPVFEWSVGGQSIDGPVSLSVNGWDDDPREQSFRRPRTATVDLEGSQMQTAARWDGPAGSTLTIYAKDQPPNIPGHFTLPVELSVRERAAGGPTTGTSSWGQLHLTKLVWEDAFVEAKRKCQDWWRDELDRHQLLNDTPLVLTLPDPPPNFLWVIEWIRLFDSELRVVRDKAPELFPFADGALNALLGRAERLE